MKPILKKDFTHSPYTGWTRRTWVDLAERMIAALQPWYTNGQGGLAFPQPYRQVEKSLPQDEQVRASFYAMEGWTRTRPLVASWLMGAGHDVMRIGDRDVDLRREFIEGFLSVSDPGSPDYISGRFGRNQWIPEVSIAAYGLWLAREKVWNPLSPAEKGQIAAWLRSSVDPKFKIPDNNWHLFQVLTGHILGDLGCDYDRQLCLDRYARAEEFYLDEGWYLDGTEEKHGFAVEQYNPWMFHFYLPALVQISTGLEPRHREDIIQRLRAFIAAYQDFFAANGGFPMWGRSWFYKPGILIPFVLAEMLECSPLSPGQSRRLVSGYMNYLIENNYFDQDMLPIMGYLTENHGLIDYYSVKGSAYWGSSAFVCLLMPEDHPFWSAPEEPLRVEAESYARNVTPVGLQIIGDKAAGETQAINHRVWHAGDEPHTRYGAKYAKFSYSSHFGIDVKRGEDGYGPDCMIQVSPDGAKYSHRMAPYFGGLGERGGLSWHYPLLGEPARLLPFCGGHRLGQDHHADPCQGFLPGKDSPDRNGCSPGGLQGRRLCRRFHRRSRGDRGPGPCGRLERKQRGLYPQPARLCQGALPGGSPRRCAERKHVRREVRDPGHHRRGITAGPGDRGQSVGDVLRARGPGRAGELGKGRDGRRGYSHRTLRGWNGGRRAILGARRMRLFIVRRRGARGEARCSGLGCCYTSSSHGMRNIQLEIAMQEGTK